MITHTLGSSDTTIILIPGGPCLPGYLGDLAQGLAEDFKVIDVELSDSLESTSPAPKSVEDYFLDLDRVHEETSSNRTIILGHSAGALLVLAHAAKNPGKWKEIILSSPGPLTKDTKLAFESKVMERMEKIDPSLPEKYMTLASQAISSSSDLKPQAYKNLFLLSLRVYFNNGKLPDNFTLNQAKSESLETTPNEFRRWMLEELFTKDLSNLSSKIHLIHGENDPIDWKPIDSLLASKLSNYTSTIIEGANHFPWFEHRKMYLESIKNWISNQNA